MSNVHARHFIYSCHQLHRHSKSRAWTRTINLAKLTLKRDNPKIWSGKNVIQINGTNLYMIMCSLHQHALSVILIVAFISENILSRTQKRFFGFVTRQIYAVYSKTSSFLTQLKIMKQPAILQFNKVLFVFYTCPMFLF